MYKTIISMLAVGLLLLGAACDQGPDPAEQMANQFQGRSGSSAPATTDDSAAADTGAESEPAADNPCAAGDAAGENPCGDAAMDNPCAADEAAEENPCAADEAAEENPCAADDAAEENPCAADEAAEENPCATDEAAEENPCAADEAAEENPCAADEEMDAADSEPLMEEEVVEEDVELDPVETFMELDPRDILRAKQEDLEGRLTAPWDEDNPDEFIPETGRVDPLTIVQTAIPEDLKPKRTGGGDENEIELYLQTVFASQLVDEVSRSLQCHSVIEIGVISTAYFAIGSGENQRRFAVQEGGGFNVNGAQVTCTSVSDTKVTVSIAVRLPGTTISRSKTYIPRSISS